MDFDDDDVDVDAMLAEEEAMQREMEALEQLGDTHTRTLVPPPLFS